MLAAIAYDPIVTLPIGPLKLSPHGIGIAVGFLLGARLMIPAAQQRGISEDTVYSLLVRAAIGSIVGARVAYVFNHFGAYLDNGLLSIFKVWEGGISLLGGILGAVLFALPRARRLGLSFWRVMDAAAPGLALGIMVGRVGDIIVADHLGKTTDFFLGYKCPPFNVETASDCAKTALSPRTVGAVVHHTALYDLILTTLLLGLLLWLRRKPRWDGFLILTFTAVYGAQRMVEDFLREDLRRFGLTGSQWTALILGLAALYVLVIRRRTPAWGQWDLGRGPAPEFGVDDDDERDIPDPGDAVSVAARVPGPDLDDGAEEASDSALDVGGIDVPGSGVHHDEPPEED